jgi:hypothetical protein
MTFRGYFALDGVEFANSSRVSAHLGRETPRLDSQAFGTGSCSTVPVRGLAPIPAGTVEKSENLYVPPSGSQKVSPGLMVIDSKCWNQSKLCGCRLDVHVDDSWDGLQYFLGHSVYRPELAPWYSTEFPESLEFGGVWVAQVTGLESIPVSRRVVEMAGSGAAAAASRDSSRNIEFEAILVACSSAGLEYGLKWLSCQLRAATADEGAVLTFLAAHPGNSNADPNKLWRESRNVVLTLAPEILEATGGGRPNQQATIYRVRWEMVACSPYTYLPSAQLPVQWDSVTYQTVNWLHDANCDRPESCSTMPVLFSADCTPEILVEVSAPPPVCGGCLPVGGLESYVFRIPTFLSPMRCRQTAVSLSITNTGTEPLSLQGHFQPADSDPRCEDSQFPVQINGLLPGATLNLDGVSGRFHAVYEQLRRRPIGVVGTPTGAPWRPAVIDRYRGWDFVANAAPGAQFSMTLGLHDRDA